MGVGAARTLSYPGNVPTVLRDIEVEYAAQMVRKLDHCSVKLKVRRERAGTETNEETGMRLIVRAVLLVGGLQEWVADLRVVVNTTIPTLHPLLSRHHLEVRQAGRQAARFRLGSRGEGGRPPPHELHGCVTAMVGCRCASSASTCWGCSWRRCGPSWGAGTG